MKTRITSISAVAILAIGAFAYPVAAAAPVGTTPSQEIVLATLGDIGVEIANSSLLDRLSARVEVAANQTAVSSDLVTAATAVVAGESGAVANFNALLMVNAAQQDQVWLLIGSIWQESYDAAQASFDSCMAAGSDASKCLAAYGATLQVNQATAIAKLLPNLLAAAESKPSAAAANAVAAIAEIHKKTVARISGLMDALPAELTADQVTELKSEIAVAKDKLVKQKDKVDKAVKETGADTSDPTSTPQPTPTQSLTPTPDNTGLPGPSQSLSPPVNGGDGDDGDGDGEGEDDEDGGEEGEDD